MEFGFDPNGYRVHDRDELANHYTTNAIIQQIGILL